MDDRIGRLERELRLVKRSAVGLLLGMSLVLLAAFQRAGRTRFTEIDVERVNIVEADGKVRLAIANSKRLPPVTFYGKEYPGVRGGAAPGIAGMIYFNDEGTENGGFGWSGQRMPDGTTRAVGMLTFDQYDQNETLALSYTDIGGQRRAGITVFDQPNTSMQPVAESLLAIGRMPDAEEQARRREALIRGLRERGEVGALRMYAGKDANKAAVVTLADPQGRPRLRLSVDSLGDARLEFLNEAGTVVNRLGALPP